MAKQYGQGKRNSRPFSNKNPLRSQINRFFDKRTLDVTEPHGKAILRSLRSDPADFFNRRILRSKPHNEAIMRSMRSVKHDEGILRSLVIHTRPDRPLMDQSDLENSLMQEES